MNLLGPCINPARPPIQLLGVADPNMLQRIAQTLDAMGVEEALVVHGSGLDEVALHGETRALRLSNGAIEELAIVPEDAGIERAPLQTVKGGEAAVPECSAGFSSVAVAKTRILQGSQLQFAGLSKGEHLFQCCIHPWMRMKVEVK